MRVVVVVIIVVLVVAIACCLLGTEDTLTFLNKLQRLGRVSVVLRWGRNRCSRKVPPTRPGDPLSISRDLVSNLGRTGEEPEH